LVRDFNGPGKYFHGLGRSLKMLKKKGPKSVRDVVVPKKALVTKRRQAHRSSASEESFRSAGQL